MITFWVDTVSFIFDISISGWPIIGVLHHFTLLVLIFCREICMCLSWFGYICWLCWLFSLVTVPLLILPLVLTLTFPFSIIQKELSTSTLPIYFPSIIFTPLTSTFNPSFFNSIFISFLVSGRSTFTYISTVCAFIIITKVLMRLESKCKLKLCLRCLLGRWARLPFYFEIDIINIWYPVTYIRIWNAYKILNYAYINQCFSHFYVNSLGYLYFGYPLSIFWICYSENCFHFLSFVISVENFRNCFGLVYFY